MFKVLQLTYFMSQVSFYTLWEYKKTRGFLMVSGGIGEQRYEMD